MSELRMAKKIADIKEIYDTVNECMKEFVMSIRTTIVGKNVNTKAKSVIVVSWKALLSFKNFFLSSSEIWWAAIRFLRVRVSWRITIWQKVTIATHKQPVILLTTK